jgi:hypothetical protein
MQIVYLKDKRDLPTFGIYLVEELEHWGNGTLALIILPSNKPLMTPRFQRPRAFSTVHCRAQRWTTNLF